MTTAEAQKAAMDQVRMIRHGQNDYFWINDRQPVVVMHPIKPELEEQEPSKVKDPNGKELFNERVKVAQLKGAGLVDYQ
ncbi:cache domain-containing protein [Stutzerimonas stutzeri]|uniref:cache domain-containing protein n=1 Tax=Stutzerimonas stutzeri TaxID=316 RepID=UPI00210F170A|nr:cache domain-containing protein [Stutzerimonas stutzeri]MCQ4321333.1 cache domain-containing protein [Stutzerimonas stutzeri]